MPTPTEKFLTGYKTLFEVQLLHRYFLNVGLTEFDQVPNDPAVQAARQAYDVSQWLRIEPSAATQELLRNQRLLFRPTAEGFRVLVAVKLNPATQLPVPFIALPPSLNFTFLAHQADPDFFLYTEGTAEQVTALMPSEAAPGGQVAIFSNTGTALVQGAETFDARIEPWVVATPRPFAVVDIAHRTGTPRSLLDMTGSPLARRFQYVMPNRRTHWEYQGSRTAYQKQRFGPYPLVRYGRIDLTGVLPFAVANPTPATTEARPDGIYYSLIY
jgi:hypothetical protein